MANIVETDNWPGGVYQYADGDVLDGGPESAEVLPLKQLAQRSLYQRLRNVTDWDATLAGEFGYPAAAVVRRAGTTWRAKVLNNVEPGTDPLAWERWAYSETELAAYLRDSLLSPVECPATGPAAAPSDASPYTIWKSVAPYAEYWMWMGDAWKVVASRYAKRDVYAFPCGLDSAFSKLTPAPRAGRVLCAVTVSYLCQAATDSAQVSVVKGAVTQSMDHANGINNAGWLASGSTSAIFDVVAGDQIGGLVHMTGYAAPNRNINMTVDYSYLN